MDERAAVMFVLCSECGAASRLATACQPAVVLQTFGGLRDPEDPATRATFEYAIQHQGVRRVLVCGHEGCRGAPRRQTVVAQCRALRESPSLGGLLRANGVVVRPLWFDEVEGDVFLCNFEDDRLVLLDDEGFGRLLSPSAVGRGT